MPQQHRYRTLIILFLIVVALGAATVLLYRSKYSEYTVRDPDSEQTIVYNSATTHTKEAVSLLGNQKLLDLGMNSGQYDATLQAIAKAITETYQEKYKTAAVNAASIKYNPETDTFTFRVRVGEIGSGQYLSVTVTTVDKTTLQLLIKDAGGKVLKEATVKTS